MNLSSNILTDKTVEFVLELCTTPKFINRSQLFRLDPCAKLEIIANESQFDQCVEGEKEGGRTEENWG